MTLKVVLPERLLIDAAAMKVVAEAQNGSFCLLPRHIGFLSALVPGLLSFTDEDDREHFVAIDEGILVKRGSEVLVSTRRAVHGKNIETLRSTVRQQFLAIDDRERCARSAIARLEMDLIRRFIQLGDPLS